MNLPNVVGSLLTFPMWHSWNRSAYGTLAALLGRAYARGGAGPGNRRNNTAGHCFTLLRQAANSFL